MKDNSDQGNKGRLSGVWLFYLHISPGEIVLIFLPKLIILVKDKAATEAPFFKSDLRSGSGFLLEYLGFECGGWTDYVCVRIKCPNDRLLAVHHARSGRDEIMVRGRGEDKGALRRGLRGWLWGDRRCVYMKYLEHLPHGSECGAKKKWRDSSWGQKTSKEDANQ